MNNLKNKVQLIGRLGMDPEVTYLDSGKVVARFRIATDESYKNKNGERVQDTQWHNVIAWGKTAEIAERFLAKGKEVGIEGKLTYRSYEDKQSVKRYATEIVVNELLLMSQKASA